MAGIGNVYCHELCFIFGHLDYIIAIVPDRQGRGLGSQLIRQIQDRAVASAPPGSIECSQANRAKALYERLGFRVSGSDEAGWFMEFAH